MTQAHWHTFQILTKRADRLAKVASLLKWPSNVWMGVSVENADFIHRIKHLREVPASVRYLSIEPLLGPLTRLPLTEIDWVIVGGESGPKARAMKAEWVRPIRDKCLSTGVPFFFKQWGGTKKAKSGKELDGRIWNELPSRKVRAY